MSGIWVWIEQHDGTAVSVSWETVGIGRKLADGLGQKVVALAFGANASALANEAIRRGADSAIVSEDASLSDFRMEPYAALVSNLAAEHNPDVIIAGSTTRGRDLMGAVAVDLNVGLLSDVISVELNGGKIAAIRPVYAGKLMAKVVASSMPQIITIRNRAFPAPNADSGRSGEIEVVGPLLTEDQIDTKVVGFESAQGSVSLTDAAIIVSGGRGVGGPDGFAPVTDLATVLGGAVGASRAAVDAGWISYEHQVGQTGKTVSPDLYIACGISGAIQHQAGMRTSKVIVAINKDPDAPIMKLAHYALVDDLFAALPAISAEFKKKLG